MVHNSRQRARSRALHGTSPDDSPSRLRAHACPEVSEDAALAFTRDGLATLRVGCVLMIEYEIDPSRILANLSPQSDPAAVLRRGGSRFSLTLLEHSLGALLDLSELEAPEPLELILERAAALGAGQALVARTPCFPRPLFAQLDRRGLCWEGIEDLDESAVVLVGRPC